MVSLRSSVLGENPPGPGVEVDDRLLTMLATMPVGHLGQSSRDRRLRPWKTVDVALAPGDVLLLIAGDDAHVDGAEIEESLGRAAAGEAGLESAPRLARVVGEYLSQPMQWRHPPDEAAHIRWTVLSRVSLAVIRVLA